MTFWSWFKGVFEQKFLHDLGLFQTPADLKSQLKRATLKVQVFDTYNILQELEYAAIILSFDAKWYAW